MAPRKGGPSNVLAAPGAVAPMAPVAGVIPAPSRTVAAMAPMARMPVAAAMPATAPIAAVCDFNGAALNLFLKTGTGGQRSSQSRQTNERARCDCDRK
jgi:hypothetical protein